MTVSMRHCISDGVQRPLDTFEIILFLLYIRIGTIITLVCLEFTLSMDISYCDPVITTFRKPFFHLHLKNVGFQQCINVGSFGLSGI